ASTSRTGCAETTRGPPEGVAGGVPGRPQAVTAIVASLAGVTPPPAPPREAGPREQGAHAMSLDGKVAIVTGGNSGIGQSIVLALAQEGANVVIDYVSHPEATEELEKKVVALGDRAIGVDADVSKVADLEALVGAAVTAFGRVDIMVNNAGIETRTGILD